MPWRDVDSCHSNKQGVCCPVNCYCLCCCRFAEWKKNMFLLTPSTTAAASSLLAFLVDTRFDASGWEKSNRSTARVLRGCARGRSGKKYQYGNKWTPSRKLGGTPSVSTRFSLSKENEQARAGRDGRTRLARPSSQARTGTGKFSFSLFSGPRAGLATLPG